MWSFSGINAKLDKHSKILEKIYTMLKSSEAFIDESSDFDSGIQFPLQSIDDLNDFEAKLSNKEFKDKVVNFIPKILIYFFETYLN